MAGLLGFHLENADEETRLTEAEPGGLDESETASAAVEEIVAENAEIAEADAGAEDVGERVELAEDLHDEVEPVVTEGAGLDRAGMAILMVGMRRVAGKAFKHLVGRDLRMESINAGPSGRREQTAIQFENLKETLKQAWEAIKSAFKKAWAKIKTWFVKTFDGSKKIKARATKIRTRAEGMSSTIENKTFNFSSAKSLADSSGKLKAAGFITGMATIKDITDKALKQVKSDNVDKAAEDMAKMLGEIKNETDVKSKITALKNKYAVAPDYANGSNSAVETTVTNSFGEDVTVTYSDTLPGGKVIAGVVGKNTKGNVDSIAVIRRTRTVFSNTKNKPKEVNGDGTETLTTSNVAKVCDHVIAICDNIFDYKKNWENRDKSQERLLKEIDDAFRDITKDSEVEASVQRLARSLAGAATDVVRREGTFIASFVSYAMSTSNIALSYCERSFTQYKK